MADRMSIDSSVITPGIYQFHYRGMTLRECWHLGSGLIGCILGLFFKLIDKKHFYVWLPAFQTEEICGEDELSRQAVKQMRPIIENLYRNGYRQGRYYKLTLNVEKTFKDVGLYRAIHDDRQRFAQVTYTHIDINSKEIKRVCTVAAVFTEDLLSLTVANNKEFFDDVSCYKSIVLPDNIKSDRILSRLDQEISDMSAPIKTFDSFDDLVNIIYAVDNETWSRKIKRGLYKKIPESKERRILEELGYDPDTISNGYI